MDDDKGTSVVLIHSEKGKKYLICVRKDDFEEAEIDKILPPSADSRKSVLMHPRRKSSSNS